MKTAKQLFAVCGLIVAACLISDAQPFLYTNNYLGVQNYPSVADIGMYRIDASTGALTSAGPAFKGVGSQPQRMAVHPSGRFLYIGELGLVRALAINSSSGTLSAISTSPLPSSSEYSDHLAMHPSGRFLYSSTNVTWPPCPSQSEIALFTINPSTGALTAGPSYLVPGSIASDITLDPTGRFLYYAVQSGCSYTNFDIHGFAVNSSTGALTELPVSPLELQDYSVASMVMHPSGLFLFAGATRRTYALGINYWPGSAGGIGQIYSPITTATSTPASTIDPSGRFFYSIDNASNAPSAVYLTNVDPYSGAMTPFASYPIQPGVAPFSAAVDPSGQFLYVTSGTQYFLNGLPSFAGAVTGYRIDASTGVLTPVAGSPFATGDGPYYLAITPFPFSTFTARVSRITWPVGILSLSASFTTGGSHQPFNPNTQWFNVQVGSYVVTVPAGSMTWTGGGWKYSGSVNGATVNVSLQWRGNGSYQLTMTALGSSALSGVASPALVSVALGPNSGLTAVSF